MVEVRKDVVAETGGQKARRRKAGDRWWEETDLAEAKADPATRMDSVVVEGRSSGAHMKFPRVALPGQSEGREVSAAGKIRRESDRKDKARKVEARREKLDEQENRTEPSELGGEINERAAAVDAGDTRVTIEEPVQRGIETGRVEDSRGTKKGEVTGQLG